MMPFLRVEAVSVGNDVEYIPSPRNLGINIISPQAKLDVNGQVLIRGGTPAAGRVLTSNAIGLASWQPITNIASIGNSTINNNTVNGNLSFNKNGSLTNTNLKGTTTINGKVLFTNNTKLEPFTVNGTLSTRNINVVNGVTASKFFGGDFFGNGAGLTKLNASQVLGDLFFATIPGANVTGSVANATNAMNANNAMNASNSMMAGYATTAGTASTATLATNATDSMNANNLTGLGSISGNHGVVSGGSIVFNTGSTLTLNSGVGIQGDQNTSVFTGNGSGLRHILASAIVGGIPNSNLQDATLNGTTLFKGKLKFASGTKVEPFTVNGTAFAKNFVAQNGGNASVSADKFFATSGFFGNGAGLSKLTGANVTGTVANATNATNATNLVSGGTIGNATLSGTITGGTFSGTHSGTGANLMNLTGAYVTGTVNSATNAVNLTGGGTVANTTLTTGNSLTGTLTNSGTINGGSLKNVTLGGSTTISGPYTTIFNATLSGTTNNMGIITGGSFSGTHTGDGAGLTNLTGANVSGVVTNAKNLTGTGTVTNTTLTTGNSLTGILYNSGTINGGTIDRTRLTRIPTIDFSAGGTLTLPSGIQLVDNAAVPKNSYITAPLVMATVAFSGNGIGLTNIKGSSVVGIVPMATALINGSTINNPTIKGNINLSTGTLSGGSFINPVISGPGIGLSGTVINTSTIKGGTIQNIAITGTTNTLTGTITSTGTINGGTINHPSITGGGSMGGTFNLGIAGSASSGVISGGTIKDPTLNGLVYAADATIQSPTLRYSTLNGITLNTGTISGGTFIGKHTGNGSGLTNLNAAQVSGIFGNITSSGTVSANLFSGSGAGLTNVVASDLVSGTTITNPVTMTSPTLVNPQVSGTMTLQSGSQINGAPTIRRVIVIDYYGFSSATCNATEYMLSGGGHCYNSSTLAEKAMSGSYPTGTQWIVSCESDSANTVAVAYAICATRAIKP